MPNFDLGISEFSQGTEESIDDPHLFVRILDSLLNNLTRNSVYNFLTALVRFFTWKQWQNIKERAAYSTDSGEIFVTGKRDSQDIDSVRPREKRSKFQKFAKSVPSKRRLPPIAQAISGTVGNIVEV